MALNRRVLYSLLMDSHIEIFVHISRYLSYNATKRSQTCEFRLLKNLNTTISRRKFNHTNHTKYSDKNYCAVDAPPETGVIDDSVVVAPSASPAAPLLAFPTDVALSIAAESPFVADWCSPGRDKFNVGPETRGDG